MRRSALAALLLAGCALLPHRLVVPAGEEPALMVLSTRLEGPIRRIVRHSWFSVRGAGETSWEKWEVMGGVSHGPTDDPLRPSFGDEVRLHAVYRGARAQRMIECLRREGPRYRYRDRYWGWPGPNCNTFVDEMLRACDIPVDLPATALGKDYRGVAGASWTSGGTGFQLESWLVGLRLGLKEGVVVHVLTLSLGLDLWPPAIVFPVGEGRLGFADR